MGYPPAIKPEIKKPDEKQRATSIEGERAPDKTIKKKKKERRTSEEEDVGVGEASGCAEEAEDEGGRGSGFDLEVEEVRVESGGWEEEGEAEE